jgi:putative iron-dependent peroxidase
MPGNCPRDLAQEILAPPAKAAIFLTLTVNDGCEEQVRSSLGDVAGLTRAIGFRVPEAQLSCVAAIGAGLWDRMYDAPRPAHLHPFAPIAGAAHAAVSTPGDLLFHLRGTRLDLCFELVHQLLRSLDGLVQPVDEVHGFRYWDERDLLGFVDGTESPRWDRDAAAVALVGAEDPSYVGGSYVIVQKYLHDLRSWERLSVAAQEQVVGREKVSNIELSEAAKPSNSHVAVTTLTDPDGTARQIVRDNMPFGNAAAGEFGTYFIGYAADPGVIERMLHRMFVGEPVGNTDRILDFSRAVTGCLFFAPPADFLERPGPTPAAIATDQRSAGVPTTVSPPPRPTEAAAPAPRPHAATGAGSLGIGSLKRSSKS